MTQEEALVLLNQILDAGFTPEQLSSMNANESERRITQTQGQTIQAIVKSPLSATEWSALQSTIQTMKQSGAAGSNIEERTRACNAALKNANQGPFLARCILLFVACLTAYKGRDSDNV